MNFDYIRYWEPASLKFVGRWKALGQINPAGFAGISLLVISGSVVTAGSSESGTADFAFPVSNDAMASCPTVLFRDDLHREILIRIETGHPLCGLVLANLRLDFRHM